MGILSWIVLGLVAGALAKLFMPGNDGGGWIVTILLGIAGAFFGGWMGSFVGMGSTGSFDLAGLFTATAGAFVLLVIYRIVKN
ncbi:MAG: GlsB/YeaQ/YmgE family stress response membrane protein [Gammaproteobacteria bacterium]|jgi:uncharacterized membrane protein YeaQ/YmgE (transglycosylase-associated protein family)|nr:GlsB/YeaQ/YmgE family stress response membrane protein [Gammaproteobacteria bacterium]